MCTLGYNLNGSESSYDWAAGHFTKGNININLYASGEGSLVRATDLMKRVPGASFCAFGWASPFRVRLNGVDADVFREMCADSGLVIEYSN